jgi:anthranilate phosphoribosyltransferase
VLQRLGSHHVLVVNGCDGLDEITISGTTSVAELKDGRISEYSVQPADFGLPSASLDSLRVSNIEQAKAMLLSVLDNQPGAARDIVMMNAGAAIYVSGLTATLADGVRRAAEIISSGAAKNKLDELVRFSKQAQS